MPDPVIRHLPTCRGVSTFTEQGRYGDTLTRCRGCHRFAVMPPGSDARTPEGARVSFPMPRPAVDTVTPERDHPPAVVAVIPVSPWCCPEHLGPVTWKGTGCPRCEDEHAARLLARNAKRLARRTKSAEAAA